MRRKLTPASLAMVVAILLTVLPAERVNAVDAEVHYTITFVCVIGPNPGVIGEWTRPCQGEMYGWGVAPYSCATGNPNYCCETDVSYGDPCD